MKLQMKMNHVQMKLQMKLQMKKHNVRQAKMNHVGLKAKMKIVLGKHLVKANLGKHLGKHLQQVLLKVVVYMHKDLGKTHHVRQAKMKLNNVGQQCILAKDLGLKAKMHHVLGKHLVKANLGQQCILMQASGTIIHHVCKANRANVRQAKMKLNNVLGKLQMKMKLRLGKELANNDNLAWARSWPITTILQNIYKWAISCTLAS